MYWYSFNATILESKICFKNANTDSLSPKIGPQTAHLDQLNINNKNNYYIK